MITRKFPVFVSLLLGGISIIGITYLLMPEFEKTLSIYTGLLSGIVVTIFEAFNYKNKCFNQYKPTVLPYIIFYISTLISAITVEIGGFFAFSPGSYLITLAVAFKIYEFKTNNHWIPWTVLLGH